MDADSPATCGNPDCTDYHAPRWVMDCAGVILGMAIAHEARSVRIAITVAVARMSGDDLWAMAHVWAECWRTRSGVADVDPDEFDGIAFFKVDGGTGHLDMSSRCDDIDAQQPRDRFAARFLIAYLRRDQEQTKALGNAVAELGVAAIVDALHGLVFACALGITDGGVHEVPAGGGR